MKKLILTAVFAVLTFGAITVFSARPAMALRLCHCPPCPAGYVLAPTPGNCCRCVKA